MGRMGATAPPEAPVNEAFLVSPEHRDVQVALVAQVQPEKPVLMARRDYAAPMDDLEKADLKDFLDYLDNLDQMAQLENAEQPDSLGLRVGLESGDRAARQVLMAFVGCPGVPVPAVGSIVI